MLKHYLSEPLWRGKKVGLQTLISFIVTSCSSVFLQWRSWTKPIPTSISTTCPQHKEKCPWSGLAHELWLRAHLPLAVDHGMVIPEGPLISGVPGHHLFVILSLFTNWPDEQTSLQLLWLVNWRLYRVPPQCLPFPVLSDDIRRLKAPCPFQPD